MNPPETYSEWVDALKAFVGDKNADEALEAMKLGQIVRQRVVYERFVRRIALAINARLESVQSKLQQSIGSMNDSNAEAELSKAIDVFKRQTQKLCELAAVPALRQEERDKFLGQIADVTQKIVEAIKKSAQFDRSGKIVHFLKNKALDEIKPKTADDAGADADAGDNADAGDDADADDNAYI